MFDDDAKQPARSWVQASDPSRPDPEDQPDDEPQSDPGGDSDVVPDPARNPEGRTLVG